jgi:hypothetical protein
MVVECPEASDGARTVKRRRVQFEICSRYIISPQFEIRSRYAISPQTLRHLLGLAKLCYCAISWYNHRSTRYRKTDGNNLGQQVAASLPIGILVAK